MWPTEVLAWVLVTDRSLGVVAQQTNNKQKTERQKVIFSPLRITFKPSIIFEFLEPEIWCPFLLHFSFSVFLISGSQIHFLCHRVFIISLCLSCFLLFCLLYPSSFAPSPSAFLDLCGSQLHLAPKAAEGKLHRLSSSSSFP